MSTRYKLIKDLDLGANVLLQRRVLRAAAPKIAAQKAGTLQYHAQRHYQNAIAQVGDFLQNPDRPNITASQTQTIQFNDPYGDPLRIRTPRWPRLSQDYADRAPESETFWKKKGWMHARYRANVEPENATVTTEVLGTKINWVRHTRAQIAIVFSRLKNPMDTYIRRYFVLGMKNIRVDGRDWVKPGTLVRGRRTMGTFVYVESRRPVISQITSRLGRNLMKLLRSNV